MAVFLPRMSAAETRGAAERKVLGWLAGLDDAWTVMHSVGIGRHESKPWAEADAVVVGPAGAVVLEVKGGRVERRNGLWGFRDRWNRVTWKAEGPWAQAGGAAAALRRDCVEAGAIGADFPLVWAVLLPDAPAPATGPEILLDVTLDASRHWANPETELLRVLRYWSTRIRFLESCPQEARDGFVRHIRGDLLSEPSPRVTARRVHEEQEEILRGHEAMLLALGRNPRVVVEGAVDAGLVHLARTTARLLHRKGERTLLCVPDDPARVQAAQVVGDQGVDVLTTHDLALDLVGGAEGGLLRPKDAVGRRALLGAAVAGAKPRYEAAVFAAGSGIGEDALTLVDRVLAGGLDAGRWLAFVDTTGGKEARVPRALLDARPCSAVITKGCRTSQVATATSVLSGRMLDVQVSVQGPAVNYVWWSDLEEHDRLLRQIIEERSRAYGQDAVALIGTEPLSQLRRHDLGGEVRLRDAAEPGTGPAVLTGRPAAYESPVVVVHGVQDVASFAARSFLYAACGSARVDLTILLRQDLREDFEEAQRAYGRGLMERMRQGAG